MIDNHLNIPISVFYNTADMRKELFFSSLINHVEIFFNRKVQIFILLAISQGRRL